MKKIIVYLIISFALHQTAHALTIFNRSPAAVEYEFDLMETFDDITDWTGAARTGWANYGIMSTDYPKRIDGSDTPINVYDYYISSDPGEHFIMDHRSSGGHIWDPNSTGSGKSLCIDISHRGTNGLGDGKNWGPSRCGTYFGSIDGVSGDHTHGYREMYVFFMVFIEKNQWPTAIDSSTRVGTYVEGGTLLYLDSWKFMTMCQGFKEPWVHWQGPSSGHNPEYSYAKGSYGWHPNVAHFHPHNEQVELMYGDINDYLQYQTSPDAPCKSEAYGSQATGYINTAIPKGQWIGVELRYTLNTRGNADGSEQFWWYESDGTVHQLSTLSGLWLQSTCEYDNGDKINEFYIGGNNSDGYLWGSTMNPRYYVDDFILHSSRIGPTYFTKKLGSTHDSSIGGNSSFTLGGNSTITFK